MSAYKDAIIASMNMLAKDPQARFIGYGLTKPDEAGLKAGGAGTFDGVPLAQRIEMPVSENLMAGFAIGLSLKGFKPVVFFERFDFVLNALDAIVNHADKLGPMSGGQFQPAVIFRVVVGNRNQPLFTSATHSQNHSKAIRSMVSFPVIELHDPAVVLSEYQLAKSALDTGRSTMLVDFKGEW